MGKRKGSRGFVRKHKEHTKTMKHAVFGGLNVGDGERPHGDARAIEYLMLQLCSGWVVEKTREAREWGRPK